MCCVQGGLRNESELLYCLRLFFERSFLGLVPFFRLMPRTESHP